MKKIIKILALSSALMLIFTACGKKNDEDKKEENKPEIKNEHKIEENKPEKDNEDEVKKEENEKETKTEVKGEKNDTGMFLGMDDSNFLVIFSGSEKKDVRFKIDPALNFENSDIELGEAVNYKYTVSEKDEKTITFIEAAK